MPEIPLNAAVFLDKATEEGRRRRNSVFPSFDAWERAEN